MAETTHKLDKNKIKIDLYKSKAIAMFSHYVSGNLYYTVPITNDGFNNDLYQFPIPTVEDGPVSVSEVYKEEDADNRVELLVGEKGKFISPRITTETTMTKVTYTKMLSSDLGTTAFYNEMKGSELIRWIGKAIDNDEFIKIG